VTEQTRKMKKAVKWANSDFFLGTEHVWCPCCPTPTTLLSLDVEDTANYLAQARWSEFVVKTWTWGFFCFRTWFIGANGGCGRAEFLVLALLLA